MTRSGYYRPPPQSEMAVFTRAKDLSKAIFVVTQDAPKKFRFSLVSKLQDTSLAVAGRLYRANEIFINLSSFSIANSLSAGCQESSLHGINCLKKAASEMAHPTDRACGQVFFSGLATSATGTLIICSGMSLKELSFNAGPLLLKLILRLVGKWRLSGEIGLNNRV